MEGTHQTGLIGAGVRPVVVRPAAFDDATWTKRNEELREVRGPSGSGVRRDHGLVCPFRGAARPRLFRPWQDGRVLLR